MTSERSRYPVSIELFDSVVSALSKLMDMESGKEFVAVDPRECGVSELDQQEYSIEVWANAESVLNEVRAWRRNRMSMRLYRTHDTPPYDSSLQDLIANLVEPTLELQGDTEDGIREWLIADPKVGDVWQDGGNDLAIERIK